MAKIVSIHSFRGGTGKSNLTANLAAQAALAGKRVAVFDTDIQSPGIHVPFGLDESSMPRTLNHYLRRECEIGEVIYPINALGGAPGREKLAGTALWLAPSSIRGEEISRVLKEGYDVSRLNEGIQTLRKQLALDYLFIDTHPGLNEETLLSIAISDILIIVLRPDQQDFQGTSVTVTIARDLEVPHLFLALNKVLPKYDLEQASREVAAKYGVAHAFALPLPMAEDLADLGSADLFTLVRPEHPWSQALRRLSAAVLAI